VVSQFPLSPVGKILKRQLREMIAAKIETTKRWGPGMKIRIIGGGPAGLYFAALMKREDPAHDVVVFERGSARRDLGLRRGLLRPRAGVPARRRRGHVPVAHAADGDLAQPHHRAQRHPVPIAGNGFAAIGRLELLSRLYAHAESLGVRIEFDSEVSSLDDAARWPGPT
jgi:2-polyprenyl-6-methoxyphenol hydroxylase-like FAD-dependent oxidoreductase